MEDQMKQCRKCGEEKSLTEYPFDKTKKDGRKNECRECRNIYLRELRNNRKKTEVPEKPKKQENIQQNSISEAEKFEKELVEFAMTFRKKEYLDRDFVSSLEKNITKFHEEAIYPPTNSFKVHISNYSINKSVSEGIMVLRSKILLFLAMKKNITDAKVNIAASPKFVIDGNLIVTLPENIKFTNKEIEDFVCDGKMIERYSFTDFSMNEINVKPYMFDTIEIAAEYISLYSGNEIKSSEIKLKKAESGVIISWPKKSALPIKEIDDIKKKMSEFIINSIIESA